MDARQPRHHGAPGRHRPDRHRRHRLRRADDARVRGRLRGGAWQVRAHRVADAAHVPVPAARGRRRRGDGHAECARPLLRPGAGAGHVQHRLHRLHRPAGAVDARVRRGAGDGPRVGGAGWWPRAGAAAVAAVAARGIPVPVRSRTARPGAARDPPADGAGHARRGRHAVQRVREHGAGDQPAGRRRVLAQLRVPHPVPAHRALRCRHRERVAAADVAAGCARGHAGPAADALARRAPGAGAHGAGHLRTDRARRADRTGDLRAWALPADRHRSPSRSR